MKGVPVGFDLTCLLQWRKKIVAVVICIKLIPYAIYTKTDLVFGFTGNQILVAIISGQKAPRTLLAQLYSGFYPKTIIR